MRHNSLKFRMTQEAATVVRQKQKEMKQNYLHAVFLLKHNYDELYGIGIRQLQNRDQIKYFFSYILYVYESLPKQNMFKLENDTIFLEKPFPLISFSLLVLIWRLLPMNKWPLGDAMAMNKWPLGDAVWERDRNAEQRFERRRYLLISSEKSQLLGEFLH